MRQKDAPATETRDSVYVLAQNLRALMARTPDLDSQPKVAARSGVGQRTVGRILLGQVAATIDTLDALANAFGMSAWELLDPTLSTRPSVDEFNRRMRDLLDRQRVADLLKK